MTTPRGVAGLAQTAGVTFPQITAARQRTEESLSHQRERLENVAERLDAQTTIVMLGSWGRRELTGESDDDFMLLSCHAECDAERSDGLTAAAIKELLGGRAAGREGTFGEEPVPLASLRDNIGLDADNNRNLTRRMLLILESVAVWNEPLHEQARGALLEQYLQAHSTDFQPPRFLLNDLVRYWRTIAVDFEGKMKARDGEGWGLRNAKLRLSRKALFAGGLLPVLDCRRHRAVAMSTHLGERMAVPPLDRIADAFTDHDAVDPGVRALQAYDEFLGILNEPLKRAELSALEHDDRRESSLFSRIKELGETFEASLLSLLFDDPALGRLTRDYLIF